jgi:signal peptidase I
LLLSPLVGCEAGRRAYLSLTHRVVRVPTENMTPTIKPGDLAVVDERYYSSRPAERFDLVIFKQPEIDEFIGQKDTIYLNRVIALGGETVEIKQGILYVNGKELSQPFSFVPNAPDEEFSQIIVPQGEYFLLGDNRRNSFDGRYWKKPTVIKGLVLGKVVEVIPQ